MNYFKAGFTDELEKASGSELKKTIVAATLDQAPHFALPATGLLAAKEVDPKDVKSTAVKGLAAGSAASIALKVYKEMKKAGKI